MSVVVLVSVQLCGLLTVSLSYPLVSLSAKTYGETRDPGSSVLHPGAKDDSVSIQNWEWTVLNSQTEEQSQPSLKSVSHISASDQAIPSSLPLYSHVAKTSSSRLKSQLGISGDNSIAHSNRKNGAFNRKVHKNSKSLYETSKSALKFPTHQTKSNETSTRNVVLQFHSDNSKSSKPDVKTPNHSNAKFSEYAIPVADQPHSLQLAVEKRSEGEGQTGASQVVIAVGTSLAVLFTLGVIIGIFGCCCKKQQQSDENENKNDKQTTDKDEGGFGDKLTSENKKPSQVFNPSDIPSGEKDLDDPISVKDKIKALDNKLIIQPSQDHVAKRKSQTDVNHTENKAYYSNNVNQPTILISEEDVVIRDKTKSKSIGDNISKSDTQDDISDKIFDNISTHSSLSQPHNPDVVIADTDEEDEFAEIQRGTVILKSFQRAKPPRNRSPATRTSKGKIRKSRPNLDRSTDQDKSKSREASRDREQASTTSSLSLSPSQGTSSKTNSLDKPEKTASKNITEKKDHTTAGTNKSDSPMTKSTDFSEFDSIMSQSITSIGSDIGNSKRHESPVSARYKKNKDSPTTEQVARTDSPSRIAKSKEREITGKEPRTESPSRYKKNTDSPKSKHRHRRRDRDRDLGNHNGRSEESTGTEVGNTNSAPNRLSGIPASMNNNIFYLIDPTVKSKCKSVGDMVQDKRRSGDYGNRKSGDYSSEGPKASKHKMKDSSDSPDGRTEETGSPEKRERTQSDPSRKSKEYENTQL